MNNLYNLDCYSFGVLKSSSNLETYINIYKDLICEDYNIFPVPKDLLDDMINFCMNNLTKSNYKEYNYIDILNKYTINWKYYQQFKENLELMVKTNHYGSITLYTYSTKDELKNILNKFPTSFSLDKVFSANAMIYSYDENFNTCLLIKTFKHMTLFDINKRIQHELIHWMQVTLNSETKKNYGIFYPLKFTLTKEDQHWFSDISIDYQMLNLIEELQQNSLEFEAWLANCVENFEISNYSLQEFKTIIENKNLFESNLNKIKHNDNILELFLFAELCYISSKNNKKDKRYWYLIEALKEN